MMGWQTVAMIETKYGIGDLVYHAGTATEAKRHPCPDCNDTRKWSAISPAGNEYTFGCPRCAASYTSHNNLSLSYTATVPCVSRRTIGSIQYNSAPGIYDHGARYMCVETGVGSGSVYSEADLFTTHDEAMAAATAKAATANATVPYIVEAYNRSLEISDYQLDNALLKQAKEATSKAGQLLWNVNDLFDTIKQAADKDAIAEAIDEYQTYYRDGDLQKLIEAADAARALASAPTPAL